MTVYAVNPHTLKTQVDAALGDLVKSSVVALGELTVRWTGGDAAVDLEFDEYAGAPVTAEPEKTKAGEPGGRAQ